MGEGRNGEVALNLNQFINDGQTLRLAKKCIFYFHNNNLKNIYKFFIFYFGKKNMYLKKGYWE